MFPSQNSGRKLDYRPLRKSTNLFVILVLISIVFACEPPNNIFHLCFYTRLCSRITSFHCSVLSALNVAPTQLHPNRWASIRAFGVLCTELSIPPTTSKFFHFYSLRLGKRARWVSLHDRHNNRLFSLFTSSYKHFKKIFFKVRSAPEVLSFILNQQGEPCFPLYWTRSPWRIADTYPKLSTFEKEEVDFLAELAPMDCQGLLKLPTDTNHQESWQSKIIVILLY